jgi:D-serine deaminase-like pyridoxal phosphate-dependent protein
MPLDYQQIKHALAGRRLPVAFVDLDAFDRNAARVRRQCEDHGLRMRVASKSVRVPELLHRLIARSEGCFRGLMCFAVEEAAFLSDQGFDDLLVAYPTIGATDLELAAALTARGVNMRLMADCDETVAAVGAAGRAAGVELAVALCVDMSLRIGPIHLGVRRSPLHSVSDVVALARRVAATDGATFAGVMGYEAQVAGLGDANPFEPLLNPAKALIRTASARELGPRRLAMVRALHDAGLAPALVNGGGTGSLDTTTRATGVTEVTAGSAFFKPHLFDYFRNPHVTALEPACFFAIMASRRPTPDIVTCLGGGYVASGAASPDKVPRPWLPEGCELIKDEMCGEVQTPVRLANPDQVALGDPVIFRHAKGGELAERFNEFLLLAGGEVVGSAATYRGSGRCFF